MGSDTITSNGELTSATEETILCDGDIIDQIIDEFGAYVVIKNVSKSDPDPNEAYESYTETVTQLRTKAFINSYSQDDEEVQEGVFKAGTIMLDFQLTDEAWVKTGNQVFFDNAWWEMAEVMPNYGGNNKFKVSARVERVQ